MADSITSTATPKLRFPAFRSAAQWETVSLGEVAEIALGKMLDDKKPKSGRLLPYINNISLRWGYVDTSKLPTMHFADSEVKRYGLKAGDVLVCEGGEPGRSAVWDGRLPDVKFQKAVHRVRFTIPFEPKFFVAYLEAIAGTIAFKALFTGGGIKHLTRETFARLEIPSPSSAEQARIADCLTSLDDVIAAQAQKVAALKAHKQGLMQQLFPREGETVPRLRFPEFRDDPAWEKRTLNQLLTERKRRNRDLRHGPADVLSVSGEFGCVNQIALLGRSYAGVSVKDYHVVETGDLVYTKSPLKRNPFGIIKANKGRAGIVSTLYAVYHTTELSDPIYLDHYFSRDYHLNRYLQPIVKKGAKNDMKVNNTAVLSGEITVPSIQEQERIADFLTSLDGVVVAETQKVKALTVHKAGLMQQLFPSPTAAG